MTPQPTPTPPTACFAVRSKFVIAHAMVKEVRAAFRQRPQKASHAGIPKWLKLLDRETEIRQLGLIST